LKIFDSPLLKPPTPTLTLSTNSFDCLKKIFKVEPSQRQLSDFNPDEDLYHLYFPKNAKEPRLTFWHNGEFFQCPILRQNRSFKLSEDREEKGFETLQAQSIY
jgi:hypothetical protein